MEPRITYVDITDTLGTPHARFSMEQSVVWIHGKNHAGKSSILDALKYIWAGGTDPGMIRRWCEGFKNPNPECPKCHGVGCFQAERSVVEFGLDNGDVVTKVTRPKRARKGGEITGYTSELTVSQPDGEPRQAPKEYIQALSEQLAVDPTVLLRIDTEKETGRRELSNQLQQLVPTEFTTEEVTAAIAKRPGKLAPDPAAFEAPEQSLNLDGLKKFAAGIIEVRRKIGVTRDDADGALKRLQSSLPAEQRKAVDHGANLAKLEDQRKGIEEAVTARKLEIQAGRAAAELAARDAHAEEIKKIDRDIDAQIEALEAGRSQRTLAAFETLDRTKETIATVERQALDELAAEAKPHQEAIAGMIGAATQMRDDYVRSAGMRDELERQRTAARSSAIRYDRLSEVLASIEELRMAKLKDVGIRGLVVEDGTAYLDGIEWHHVNRARRVEAVLEICTRRAGKLKFIMIDDAEHMDSETRALITEGLIVAGWQVIQAFVDDGPLTIETRPMQAAA